MLKADRLAPAKQNLEETNKRGFDSLQPHFFKAQRIKGEKQKARFLNFFYLNKA